MMDHEKQAASRIYSQYRDKQKLVAWIKSTGKVANELEGVFAYIRNSYNIDKVEDGALDVIGRVVGIARSGDLGDEFYRRLIKSRIVKNNSDGTTEDIYKCLKYIAGGDNFFTVKDGGNMTFSVEIDGALGEIEIEMLKNYDVLPRPQGVEFVGYLDIYSAAQCNIDGLYQLGDDTYEFVAEF